jgi:tetratricopeptide (TPR) repeat protein
MRLGQPKAALATAEQLLEATQAEPERRLRERLRRGLRAVEQAAAELRAGPAPALLHRLARAYLADLGDPRRALEHCFRILAGSPEVAATIFACYQELGADVSSHRVLERAAKSLGTDGPTAEQALLLAEAAAAGGQPETAIRWLDCLPRASRLDRALADRVAAVCLKAAEHFQASGASDRALAAWKRAASSPTTPAAARASLLAGELLAKTGRHSEAARCLLAAIGPAAATGRDSPWRSDGPPSAAQGPGPSPERVRLSEPATVRRALHALTVGRLRRLDPAAYDAARVGELARFGFLDSAVRLGEQVISGLPETDPYRGEVGRHLAAAFDRLVAYHLALGDVDRAKDAVTRWLPLASPRHDLPRALAHLAACQRVAGQRRARIQTLSRLAIEFADRPEGAEARRQLRLLNSPAGP